MRYDAFRSEWLDAIRAARLVTHSGPEDLVDLTTMSRKHVVYISASTQQATEPFFVTMKLGFTWNPLQSARTHTCEEDLLAELLGREQSDAVVTERPWVRADIELHAKLPWGEPLRLTSTDGLRRWMSEVPRALEPTLRTRVERNAHRIEAVHASLGKPEASVQCDESGKLLLLGIELQAFRAVHLERMSEAEEIPFDGGTGNQLRKLAVDAAAALEAWARSLSLLKTGDSQP